jgi:phage FluMu protein Com
MAFIDPSSDDLKQIRCLACGELRVVFGSQVADAGACPRCRYVGWTYAEDLDGTTKQMIMSRLPVRPSLPARGGVRGSHAPTVAACGWKSDRSPRRFRPNSA